MRKNRMAAIAIALFCVLSAGYGALAVQAGSQGDPLVTLSYLVNIFRPAAVDAAVDQAQSSLQAYQTAMTRRLSQSESTLSSTLQQVDTLMQNDAFAKKVADAAGLSDSERIQAENAMWKSVTLSAGQSMTAPLGTQVLLRSGTAAAGMALQDLTSGAALASGKALSANHLYLVPAQGLCLKAGKTSVVLVRGAVTIG